MPGGGEFTSDSVGRVLPKEADLRSRAAQQALAAVEKKRAAEHRHTEILQERFRQIAEQGIRVGRQWAGAQTYVQGRKGMMTYDRATVLAIDEQGFVSVECYKSGMHKPDCFTVEPSSRLFETIANPVQPAQPPKQRVAPRDDATAELFGGESNEHV